MKPIKLASRLYKTRLRIPLKIGTLILNLAVNRKKVYKKASPYSHSKIVSTTVMNI